MSKGLCQFGVVAGAVFLLCAGGSPGAQPTSAPATQGSRLLAGQLPEPLTSRVRQIVLAQVSAVVKSKRPFFSSISVGRELQAAVDGQSYRAVAYRSFGVIGPRTGELVIKQFYVKTTNAWKVGRQTVIPAGTYLCLRSGQVAVEDPAATTKPAAVRPRPKPKPKTRPARQPPKKLIELERYLMHLPAEKANNWLGKYHRLVKIEVAMETQRPDGDAPPQPGKLTALAIHNRTPCYIKVLRAHNTAARLYVDGAKPKAGENELEWIAPPGKTLVLAVKPGIRRIGLMDNVEGARLNQYARGPLCDIEIRPNRTQCRPIPFSVQYELLTARGKVVASGYLLGNSAIRQTRQLPNPPNVGQ